MTTVFIVITNIYMYIYKTLNSITTNQTKLNGVFQKKKKTNWTVRKFSNNCDALDGFIVAELGSCDGIEYGENFGQVSNYVFF